MKRLKNICTPFFTGTLTLIAVGILFTASGCKKDNESVADTIESAEDNAKMENEMNNVLDAANSVQKNSFGKTSGNDYLPSCATVTIDSTSTPKTKTITFSDPIGLNGACLCNDGIYRKGSIKIEFYGEKDVPGFKRVLRLVDYYSGPTAETNFMGKKTWTYEGLEKIETGPNIEATAKKFTIKVEDGKAVDSEGSATWQSQRTIWQTKGLDTPEITDDAYLMRGTASGVNRKGVSYSVVIDDNKPLKKDFDKCGLMQQGDLLKRGRFISGVWTLNNSNGKSMTLDYDPIGGEPCDRTARITINGKTKDFIVR